MHSRLTSYCIFDFLKDPRNAVAPTLPSQIKKMAAKNQYPFSPLSPPLSLTSTMPPPIQMPGSPMKRSPSAPVPETPTSPSSKPPSLSLDRPLSPLPDRKQPPPTRPSRHHAEPPQPAPLAQLPDQIARDQLARFNSTREQPARDQPARDDPPRPAFIGKPDSPDQVRSSARQNSLAGGSRAMLAQSRIPQSHPPRPPPSVFPPPPAPPVLPLPPPPEPISAPEEAISPRLRARPGFVAVLPMPPDVPNKESRSHLSPQKLPPPPAVPQDLDFPASSNDKKTSRRSPHPPPPPADAAESEPSLFPRLPLPPPPSLPTPNPSSNLTNVYSTLPPPPPLPGIEEAEIKSKLRTSAGDVVRKENTKNTWRRSTDLDADYNIFISGIIILVSSLYLL